MRSGIVLLYVDIFLTPVRPLCHNCMQNILTQPLSVHWLFDRLGLRDANARRTIDRASHSVLVLDEGVEMDLSVPDLTGKWIPSWPCDSCTEHNLIDATLMFAGTIETNVLAGQKVILSPRFS